MRVLLLAILVIGCIQQSLACAGAPYLYVSFHGDTGGVNNIYKYSRDGCFLGALLSGGSPNECRKMVVLSDKLIVTSAKSSVSAVLEYGKCNADGQRSYTGSLVTISDNAGLDHPYGLAVDPSGNVYVSNQHTDNVLRFYPGGAPIPLPSALNDTGGDYYPGTFVQYGAPGEHSSSEQGIRGITFIGSDLLVCNEDLSVIERYNVDGQVTGRISVSGPIGLLYDEQSNTLYYSSKDDNVVVAVDATSLAKKQVFTDPTLAHPAGMARYQDTLFVISQDNKEVIKFDALSGSFLGPVVSNLPDSPEQIALSFDTC